MIFYLLKMHNNDDDNDNNKSSALVNVFQRDIGRVLRSAAVNKMCVLPLFW